MNWEHAVCVKSKFDTQDHHEAAFFAAKRNSLEPKKFSISFWFIPTNFEPRTTQDTNKSGKLGRPLLPSPRNRHCTFPLPVLWKQRRMLFLITWIHNCAGVGGGGSCTRPHTQIFFITMVQSEAFWAFWGWIMWILPHIGSYAPAYRFRGHYNHAVINRIYWMSKE
jgi:hypothetical protein